MSEFETQRNKIATESGFIAALDQSGGSTPKALTQYGLAEDAWSTDEEMYALVHEMRARIITSPAFNGERLIGAILFENTIERDIEGRPTCDYLWNVKGVIPFLKVDKGLEAEQSGVQLMKPIGGLAELLARAKPMGVFGTKMRSVVKQADSAGISLISAQQFQVGKEILAAGLVPILEPEIDIHCPDKAHAEQLLQGAILEGLAALPPGQQVMLKLTLPETPNFYAPLIAHESVLKVVALSGGYSREEANRRLAQNNGMVASFSRALAEGLSAQQSDDEFNATLEASIQSIYEASRT